jgi:hypothetical protein
MSMDDDDAGDDDQDQPPVVRGSDTSKDAGASMLGQAPVLRARVLALIAAAGASGHTCDEIEQLMRMRHQTASARICELRDRNQVRDSGLRRKTRSGRRAVVWVAVA